MKNFEFCYERASAYVNGTYYVRNRKREIPVTVRSRKNRSLTRSVCFGVEAIPM